MEMGLLVSFYLRILTEGVGLHGYNNKMKVHDPDYLVINIQESLSTITFLACFIILL